MMRNEVKSAIAFLTDSLSVVSDFFADYAAVIWAALLFLALFACLLAWLQTRKTRKYKKQLSRMRTLIETIRPAKGLEQNLQAMLELFGSWVEADTYAFYVYDAAKKHFALKALRNKAEDPGKVGPSYSGLAPFQKEGYVPPLSLSADSAPARIGIVREGEVPLLVLPVGVNKDAVKGLVRIGPLGKVNKRTITALSEMVYTMQYMLDQLVDSEHTLNQAQVVVASGWALQRISSVAMHPQAMMEIMLGLIAQSVGASGGCSVEKRDNRYHLSVHRGLQEQTRQALIADEETLRFFHSFLAQNDFALLKRGEESYYRIPPYLAALAADAFAIIAADEDRQNFLLFWFKHWEDGEDRIGIDPVQMAVRDVRAIVDQQVSIPKMSDSYFHILKMLAHLLDNLSPYTVGYSDLMSRYAVVIARELGLGEEVIRDVAVAAYLSNIGVMGISTDLIYKEGQFSEQEFEMMKLHAEVGAAIVRIATGNERIASYIMHHHERMDGGGYPGGLKGENIPIGARIIAVIQTFLAKINGRKYRDPLPFHQALQTLRAASGTQLDPQIVESFVRWFQRKQSDSAFSGKSLGSCWEMCCTPSHICEQCPVYRRTDVNCWEVAGNRCKAHGKSCATCFVRTEFANRGELRA